MSAGWTQRQRQYLDRMGLVAWERRATGTDTVEGASGADARPPPAAAAAPESAVATMDWDRLADTVAACRRCALAEGRRNTVFGVGDPEADLLVIGEAPGEQEDRRGEPFVGPAGQLLDQMLQAVGVARGRRVYIANTLKCRPPRNRDPQAAEVAACAPYLDRQIALLQPRVILAVGRIAAHYLLSTDAPLRALRQGDWTYPGTEIPVIVSYHPSYLLRTPADKGRAWQDLKRLIPLLATERKAASP